MKSNRLFAIAALFGAISFAMPLHSHAGDNSIEASAMQMHAGEADVKDAGITSRIKTALAIDPITKSATIHVETDHGIVNLTGDVPNVLVVQEAQEVAQNTAQVKSVRNNLKVDKTSNASFEM